MDISTATAPKPAWYLAGMTLKTLFEWIRRIEELDSEEQEVLIEELRELSTGRIYRLVRQLDQNNFPNEACMMKKLLHVVADEDLTSPKVAQKLVQLYQCRGKTAKVINIRSMFTAGGHSY